jgi:ABC-type nickel/cobalt efflux system permease component RcnA
MQPQETNGKSIAALVLGILSIIIPYVGLILGIIGLVLASSSLKEIAVTGQGGRGLAIAGRVTSIIGVAIYGIIIFFVIIGIALFATDPYYW